MASAVDTTNHRLLPEEGTSTDEDSHVDARHFTLPSDTRIGQASKSYTYRYHPTGPLRFIAACLVFTSLIMNAVDFPEPAALVFLILAFLRQVQVLFNHYLSHWVRLRSPVQIITNNVRLPASPLPRTGPPHHRYAVLHVCLDIIIVLGLTIALSIEAAQQSPSHYWRYYYRERKFLGAIVGLSSCLPLILSIVDTGAPRSVLVSVGLKAKARLYKMFFELDVGLEDNGEGTSGLLDDIYTDEEAGRRQVTTPSKLGGK